MKRFSKVLTLILVLALILCNLPAGHIHAESVVGKVRVIVENTTFNSTTAKNMGVTWRSEFWTGTLVNSEVALTNEDSAMSCLVKALKAAGKSVKGAEAGYVSNIAGLEEFDGGRDSGWVVTINDWFINAGAQEFSVGNNNLFDGDVIRFMYTIEGYGKDCGCDVDSSDTSLSALTCEDGNLSPAFDSETKSYTMEVPVWAEEVRFNPTAFNKIFNVTIKKGKKEYRRNQAIPVKNGDEIKILIGDGLNMCQVPYTTGEYSVTIAKENPISPDTDKVSTAITAVNKALSVILSAIAGGRKAQTQIVDISMIKSNGSLANVVPKDVLQKAEGNDIDVRMDFGSYSWKVNGRDVVTP